MNQRCLKEFKVKYTKKENTGGQRLISIFSLRSGSEALAVSLENYCSPVLQAGTIGGAALSGVFLPLLIYSAAVLTSEPCFDAAPAK